MISVSDRGKAIVMIQEASDAGARRYKSCEILGLTLRTLERWEKENGQCDKRSLAPRIVANKLSQEQRDMVLITANSAPYQHLPPSKIVPLLADNGRYLAF